MFFSTSMISLMVTFRTSFPSLSFNFFAFPHLKNLGTKN
jgi:hypothetical protein